MRIAILVPAIVAAAAAAPAARAQPAEPAPPAEPAEPAAPAEAAPPVEPTPPAAPAEPTQRPEPARGLRPQLQADVGLAVVGLGFELPIAARFALQAEGQIFGTYFLPWFDAGDRARGLGGQLRATWFLRPTGRGLYVLAFGRLDAVTVTRDDLSASGHAISAGGVVGWAFGLTRRLDLRVGLGVQYIHMSADAAGTELGAATPFPTLDGVFGYRL